MLSVPDDSGELSRALERGASALSELFAELAPERQAQVVSPLSSRIAREDTYERLEYVGDGALELVIRLELFRRHRTASEAKLTLMRDWVVGREVLALLARAAGLAEAMRARLEADLGVEGSVRRTKRQSDLLEALIGAAWFDLGAERTERAIISSFEPALEAANRVERDAKSRLHHIAQVRGMSLRFEHARRASGTPSAHFECWVVLEDQRHGPGRGPSKRIAEQAASAACLRALSAAVG